MACFRFAFGSCKSVKPFTQSSVWKHVDLFRSDGLLLKEVPDRRPFREPGRWLGCIGGLRNNGSQFSREGGDGSGVGGLQRRGKHREVTCGGAENRKKATQARQRWTLDNVERISRGRPSLSKLGSRAVPHRLRAEERTAFEIAKRKRYLSVRVGTRRYPLINTFRNFCDARGWPYIRIEQGGDSSAGDMVYVDFSTLHFAYADTLLLQKACIAAATGVMPQSALLEKLGGDNLRNMEAPTEASSELLLLSSTSPTPSENGQEEGEDVPREAELQVRWNCTRQESKKVAQAMVECCDSFLKSDGKFDTYLRG